MSTDSEVIAAALMNGSDEERYAALADSPPAQYDRLRESFSKAMGIRVTTLDAEVARRRPQGTPSGFNLSDVPQWPKQVSGSEVLDSIAAELERYIVMPPAARDAIALWTLLTYVVAAVFILPLLLVTSPQPRCGKSNLLMLLLKLCNRAVLASNMSHAVLFRMVNVHKPTLLLDETDTWAKENEELRGIINCGHSKETAHVWRCDGDALEPRPFDTFTPKVISGINAKSLAGTITDRAIVIELKRRAPGERVQPLRQDRLDFSSLQSMAARWAADHLERIRDADAAVPKSLNDRAADNWRPLLAIADLAGGTWPARARAAAVALSGADRDDDDINVMLLGDIRAVFESSAGRMSSQDLCNALAQLTERPWSEWKHGKPISPPKLARRLKPFGVATRILRTGQHVFRGYDLEDFADTFSRYLQNGEKSVTSLQTLENSGKSADFSVTSPFGCNTFSVTPENRVTEKSGEFAEKNSTCNDVTEKKRETGGGGRPMTPRQALATCFKRGIRVSIHGDKLRLAPAAALDPDLLEQMRHHKQVIIALLAGPAVDEAGLPFEHCRVCGAPNWWTSDAAPGWHCSYCVERPEPFLGRIVVVCGGKWGQH